MQPGVNPVGEVSSLPHFFSEPMESDSFFAFFWSFLYKCQLSTGNVNVRIIILKKKFHQMLKKFLSSCSLNLQMLLKPNFAQNSYDINVILFR